MAKTVYVAVSTDILHGGHIQLIKNAATLGDVMIGLFTDEAVASYKRFPLLDYEERKKMSCRSQHVQFHISPARLCAFHGGNGKS